MLRFGIVSQINPITVQARVSFEDDESTSFWLPILQTKTLKDKFYIMPDIGEQVVCLMDENSEDGVILGSIYSSEDIPVVQSENEISMNLEDGSSIIKAWCRKKILYLMRKKNTLIVSLKL